MLNSVKNISHRPDRDILLKGQELKSVFDVSLVKVKVKQMTGEDSFIIIGN